VIALENVTKRFVLRGQRNTVLNDLTAVFPTGKAVALLGRNGAGKSTLMKIISGTMDPTTGRIRSTGTISWPVGFAGSFHGELTGAQNIRFLARIYGTDTEELSQFVQDFAQLGAHFFLPFRTYSSGMKARLAFGASMGIRFDTYLVDEVTAVGDAAFKEKSRDLFNARMEHASAVVVTHSMEQVRSMCHTGAVLENGNMVYYEDLEEAIAHHLRNMKV